jgi:hypothetical protein
VSAYVKAHLKKYNDVYFDKDRLGSLKEIFLMSHMRDLESRLRHDTTSLEEQIMFLEFLDLEFDPGKKEFCLAACYTRSNNASL